MVSLSASFLNRMLAIQDQFMFFRIFHLILEQNTGFICVILKRLWTHCLSIRVDSNFSHELILKFTPIRLSVDSCIPFFLKFGQIQQCVDSCITLEKFEPTVH